MKYVFVGTKKEKKQKQTNKKETRMANHTTKLWRRIWKLWFGNTGLSWVGGHRGNHWNNIKCDFFIEYRTKNTIELNLCASLTCSECGRKQGNKKKKKTATERTQHRKWFDICTFSVCCKTEGRRKKKTPQITKSTVASWRHEIDHANLRSD